MKPNNKYVRKKAARIYKPWQGTRTSLEDLVEAVLNADMTTLRVSPEMRTLAYKVMQFDARETKVVILGGGTGLSTVVGGNAQRNDWARMPFVGLKEEFSRLKVIVCTTDDGGSTGHLLKTLPMIAVGDLRKSCVSLILSENLQRTYRINREESYNLVQSIQRIFNYRFPEKSEDERWLSDPSLTLPTQQRKAIPRKLSKALRTLGAYVAAGGKGPAIDPSGHCLGNLLLTAAIFQAAGGRVDRPPRMLEIHKGLDVVARLIGVTPGCLFPATATPGQLQFRYANGVEVFGQSKSASARRNFPVDWLTAEFSGTPVVSETMRQSLREADLIILAPGSLYTSIIPVLQIKTIAEAIRANRKALKVLGANFWIQEGETDISHRKKGQEFCVSELMEAYDRNVPGGARGLFQLVLSANLEHMPGNILRNYALEGKRPIHLDRARVTAMGFQPVEATLFSPDQLKQAHVIQHDAGKFALALRSILYAHKALNWIDMNQECIPTRRSVRPQRETPRSPLLCRYLSSVEIALSDKIFHPPLLKKTLLDLAWDNRNILPEHLNYFRAAQIISAKEWHRSTDWDNVLGFYDPDDHHLKLHEHLLDRPVRLREDLLIALGESLLGRYIESRKWIKNRNMKYPGVRCYEIRLRPADRRACYLSPAQLHTYLKLARMIPDPRDPGCYRMLMNNNEGFLPSGLLFGLMYAWYLNNAYGGIMEYEMSLLRWSPRSLLPHQAKERIRRQALVNFFRSEVFSIKNRFSGDTGTRPPSGADRARRGERRPAD